MLSKSLPVVALVLAVAAMACKSGSSGASAPAANNTVTMEVTEQGFVPANVTVKKDQPVKLVITRKTEKTCATDIVIKDYGVQKALPQDQTVEVTFTPTKPGPIRYACAMDMVAGQLVAE